MKNSLIFFMCVILAVCAFVKADTCNIDGHVLKVGETYSVPNACEQIKCTGKDSFEAKGCPESAVADKNYKYIAQDNSKPYPKCCAHFQRV